LSNRREFLLLADTFKADKHDPIGMIASEKLDGNRVWYDGGITRGRPTTEVPWASIHNPKTGELKDKIKPVATGLWSRYGNPIQAPRWFLDQLPPEPLDGELYAGRGNFQLTQTIVRRDDPNAGDWSKIQFIAFGVPTFTSVFRSGLIKNANMLREIDLRLCRDYVHCRGFGFHEYERTYLDELCVLDDLVFHYGSDVFNTVHVERIDTMDHLDRWLKYVTSKGGEGLMLRDPDSVWFPKRRPFLLKVKPRHDAEATIVGFTAGRKGKTGQFLGKLGTLNCVWHGDPTAPCGLLKKPVEFEIGTGLTHAERELDPKWLFEKAAKHPGERLDCESTQPRSAGTWRGFRVGDRVTFSYMGVTNDNAPREPAFIRIREDA
jgi:hypothetical protein